MAFVVIFDSCVLYPPSVRDALMHFACTDLFQARWTERILDDCFSGIVRDNLDKPNIAAQLARTRRLMNDAVRDALVSGYEDLVPNLKLPDPNDGHVLAAAIRSGAQVIVTQNIKHFPEECLDPYDIEAQTPDTFTLYLLSLNEQCVIEALTEQAAVKQKPPMSLEDLLDKLEERGFTVSVPVIRDLLASRF
jgi:hypothetical protein